MNSPTIAAKSMTAQAVTAFENVREDALALAELHKHLELPDPSDRKRANEIAAARKSIKQTRCNITNLKKELTAPVLECQREIKAVADELIAILAPEESRLSLLENDRKEWIHSEKVRLEAEKQELIDNRVATMFHLGRKLAPSVAGALDEKSWGVILNEATDAHELHLAEVASKEMRANNARVTHAARFGHHLKIEDAKGMSRESWRVYADLIQRDAEGDPTPTPQAAERAKDAEVEEAIEVHPVVVRNVPTMDINLAAVMDLAEALEAVTYMDILRAHIADLDPDYAVIRGVLIRALVTLETLVEEG